jgi:hypothetical protein
MPSIYFYKLVSDSGAAPCIKDNLLSLAICKPMIRESAKENDFIFGFSANSLHADNRLIYVARITEEIPKGRYYIDPRFAGRVDRIYEQRGAKFVWKTDALYHDSNAVDHDLGKYPEYERAKVLLSNDFRYFGRSGNADYKLSYPRIKAAIENLGRGHRKNHGDDLREQLEELKKELWKKTQKRVLGEPMNKPAPGVCYRARFCGVVSD